MSDKAPARERLLKAASELFYRDGVSATGIDAIINHAGVARMSLYNNFSSKADLVSAYVHARNAEWQDLCKQRLEQAQTPRDKILAVFDSYVDHAGCSFAWGFRGCGLLNAAAELPVGEPARAIVISQKEEVESLFRQYLLELTPRERDPDGAASIDKTAEHLSFLLEGAMARAGLEGHDARLATARQIAISIIDRA
ncbi:TetR/AcrR family transcriptional regulator [Pseudochelatococcus contaminans]|uniref:AcrR family transcriptional regulator n=1 Tax=Pseudochelatococcus contaminans TaxID=1538103 RepID=A0A7W6EGQ1_9HYPH|nr:TetR/AcrR family transcriptional regulator [Pseudochelatococcus contaminans]MBB3809555.1 AcrR family transcriptional regulator [Pseudochelatococcus contaminans]